MILIKGFFKYKSTKIYIFVFVTMLIILSLLFGFSKYYSNIVTNTYQDNSYFILISKQDMLEDIKKSHYADNIEEVALLIPSDIEEMNHLNVNVNTFVDQDNNFIIVKLGDIKDDLKENQIIIEFPKFTLDSLSNLSDLTSKNIFLKISNEKLEFNIRDVRESNFSRIIVSRKIFDKLLSNKKYYAYTFVMNDYSNIKDINNYFKSFENVEIKFLQYYENVSKLNTIQALEKTFDLLSKACFASMMIFVVLYLIIMCNIIFDEVDRMYLEKLLGFNKKQLRKILMMKITALHWFIIFLFLICDIGIKVFIRDFLNVSIEIFSYNIICIMAMLFILSIILVYSFGVNRFNIKCKR